MDSPSVQPDTHILTDSWPFSLEDTSQTASAFWDLPDNGLSPEPNISSETSELTAVSKIDNTFAAANSHTSPRSTPAPSNTLNNTSNNGRSPATQPASNQNLDGLFQPWFYRLPTQELMAQALEMAGPIPSSYPAALRQILGFLRTCLYSQSYTRTGPITQLQVEAAELEKLSPRELELPLPYLEMVSRYLGGTHPDAVTEAMVLQNQLLRCLYPRLRGQLDTLQRLVEQNETTYHELIEQKLTAVKKVQDLSQELNHERQNHKLTLELVEKQQLELEQLRSRVAELGG